MVSTSDHETGGLAVARQLHETYPDYLWYPGVLANASHSASWAAHQYHDHLMRSAILLELVFAVNGVGGQGTHFENLFTVVLPVYSACHGQDS